MGVPMMDTYARVIPRSVSAGTMATGGSWTLTDRVIARLAAQITPNDMEIIAEEYLGLDHVMVQDLRQTQGSNPYGFKVEVLHKWAKMNPGDNQAKVGFWTLSREHALQVHNERLVVDEYPFFFPKPQ